MELISDNSSPTFNRRFASAWFGGVLLALWVVGFNWLIVSLLAFGLVGAFYYWVKVKNIYYCGDAIKILNGLEYIEVRIENIVDVNSRANLYRINFREKTDFGYHIRFTPRLEGKFFEQKPHRALAELMKKVNN